MIHNENSSIVGDGNIEFAFISKPYLPDIRQTLGKKLSIYEMQILLS